MIRFRLWKCLGDFMDKECSKLVILLALIIKSVTYERDRRWVFQEESKKGDKLFCRKGIDQGFWR